MKKLITLFLAIAGYVGTASAADPSFLGNGAINVNGTWYYAGQSLGWCTGAFNGADLGTITTTLAIGGKSEAYDSGSNWNSGTVTMHYRIDSESESTIDLVYYSFENNNNIFQSGGSLFTSYEIDLTGLTCGEHNIEVWFNCGSTWDSNDSKNYKAKFTIADTYVRSVTSGNFGTICLPYAATVTGATVFKITGKVLDGSSNLTGINLTSVDALEAGKAYIFKATSSTLTATFSGNYTAASAGYGMMGNLSSSDAYVPQNAYVVSGNQIHKVTADNGVTIGQYKGYITLDGIAAAARGANFIGFDEASGISQIEQGENATESYFNLAGQRIAQPTKGLYIVNGKKILVK